MIWIEPIMVAGVSIHLKHLDNLLSDDVILEREPNNPVHNRAVMVSAVKDGVKQKLGYVPRDLADMVREEKLPAMGRIVWKRQKDCPALRIQV
jgi:hypothetical protein